MTHEPRYQYRFKAERQTDRDVILKRLPAGKKRQLQQAIKTKAPEKGEAMKQLHSVVNQFFPGSELIMSQTEIKEFLND